MRSAPYCSPRRSSRWAAVSVAVVLALPPLVVVVGSSPAAASVASREMGPISAKKRCVDSGKQFRPTVLGIPGISKRRQVLALGRDRNNVPQAPPLSDAGKHQFAWDAKDAIKAGSKHGVIKLNAHTYPDGSAIGNDLINKLYAGNRLVVRGKRGQQRCYEVVDRVQIPAEKRFRRYYRTDGPSRLAIAVCSGVRRGPGDWSHRTIWFAKQIR